MSFRRTFYFVGSSSFWGQKITLTRFFIVQVCSRPSTRISNRIPQISPLEHCKFWHSLDRSSQPRGLFQSWKGILFSSIRFDHSSFAFPLLNLMDYPSFEKRKLFVFSHTNHITAAESENTLFPSMRMISCLTSSIAVYFTLHHLDYFY